MQKHGLALDSGEFIPAEELNQERPIMTTTPHGQVPEARCQACIYRHDGVYGSWAPDCPVHNYDGTLRTAHVQNPAEIEHVAGDVSKNGAEVNMSTVPSYDQQVAVYAELPPRYYLAGGVEKTWDQQQMRDFADATHALRTQQPAPAPKP